MPGSTIEDASWRDRQANRVPAVHHVISKVWQYEDGGSHRPAGGRQLTRSQRYSLRVVAYQATSVGFVPGRRCEDASGRTDRSRASGAPCDFKGLAIRRRRVTPPRRRASAHKITALFAARRCISGDLGWICVRRPRLDSGRRPRLDSGVPLLLEPDDGRQAASGQRVTGP